MEYGITVNYRIIGTPDQNCDQCIKYETEKCAWKITNFKSAICIRLWLCSHGERDGILCDGQRWASVSSCMQQSADNGFL